MCDLIKNSNFNQIITKIKASTASLLLKNKYLRKNIIFFFLKFPINILLENRCISALLLIEF